MIFALFVTLSTLSYGVCNTAQANIITSDAEYIVNAIGNPRKMGLFSPYIYLPAEQKCTPMFQHDARYGNLKATFDHHCGRFTEPSRSVDTKGQKGLDQFCQSIPVWKQCFQELSLLVDQCYIEEPHKGTNSLQFTYAFADFYCENTNKFESMLMDDDGKLVCYDATLKNDLVSCARQQVNAPTANVNDLCWSIGAVNQCYSSLYYDDQCTDEFANEYMQEMMMSIHSTLKCPVSTFQYVVTKPKQTTPLPKSFAICLRPGGLLLLLLLQSSITIFKA